MAANGQQQRPVIQIFWNNEKQEWAYTVDGGQLKNGEMIEAILYLCHQGAQSKNRIIKAQAMAQQQMQAAHEEAIRQKLIQH